MLFLFCAFGVVYFSCWIALLLGAEGRTRRGRSSVLCRHDADTRVKPPHRVVAVSNGGFEDNGEPYSSLNAIADVLGVRDGAKKQRKGTGCMSPQKRRRCAIDTRKFSGEGGDLDFNAIDARRDAGHAYIAGQCAEGWIPVSDDHERGAGLTRNTPAPSSACRAALCRG